MPESPHVSAGLKRKVAAADITGNRVRRDARRLDEAPASPASPPTVTYDSTVGPKLSPIQSALQAAMAELVTRGDRRNPLGNGDWRARAGPSPAPLRGEDRLTVRQLPGEDNALGRIAFMFPNDHAVYLHDTPARELFDEESRAFSHGCVRVEDPVRLAALVLDGESGGWTQERIEAAFGTRERAVFLPRPLPVHIEYFTEFVAESGELQQRRDVYGWTRGVEGVLARESQD